MTGEQRNELRAARRLALIAIDYLNCIDEDGREPSTENERDDARLNFEDAVRNIDYALIKGCG